MPRLAPAKTTPILVCKPDEHILCSCKACGNVKVAPMHLAPFCSTACRARTGG